MLIVNSFLNSNSRLRFLYKLLFMFFVQYPEIQLTHFQNVLNVNVKRFGSVFRIFNKIQNLFHFGTLPLFKFHVLFLNGIFHFRQALLCYIKIVSFSCSGGAGNIAKQLIYQHNALFQKQYSSRGMSF